MRYKSFAVLFSLLYAGQTNGVADVAESAKKAYDKAVVSSELKKTFGNIVKKAKKAFDGGISMLKGMGQSFGIVSPNYQYNYLVFNDSPAPIYVAEERLTGLLGATFSGEIKMGLAIGPNGNSGNQFFDRQLYVSVWICADKDEKHLKKYAKSSKDWAGWGALAGAAAGMGIASPITGAIGAALGALAGVIATVVTLKKYKLYEKSIYPWPSKDDKIYYYRAYTYKGELKGEYLDLCGTTSAFSGQFYNRSKGTVLLEFSKDGNPYMVTLEPDSFSLLESSKHIGSIRPPSSNDHSRGFQFYKDGVADEAHKFAFMPIAALGIGNVVSTQKDKTKPTKRSDLVVTGPKLYTYEVYDTFEGPEVGLQGLKIGHFDQPASGRVRDINPVVCHLWYKNAVDVQKEQAQQALKHKAKQDHATIPFDVPEQLWISYKTKDYTLHKKVAGGSIVDFYLVRPQLVERSATLYMVSLQAKNDAVAEKFLERLHAQKIGQKALYTDAAKEEQFDTNTLLTFTPNIYGFIKDDQGPGASGATGAVVLTDSFLPEGVGAGSFYYELEPTLLRVDQFANCVWFDKAFYAQDVKTKALIVKPETMQDLAQKLPTWVKQYKTDQAGAKMSLRNYLQEKANKGLFVDAAKPPAQREFTEQGKALYQALIDGPISIKNPPVMRKTGMNWYTRTLGGKPTGWDA